MHRARASRGKVLLHVVGRNDAVAVEKDQVRRRGDAGSVIPATGEVKAFVPMRKEPHGQPGRLRELADHPRRFVG